MSNFKSHLTEILSSNAASRSSTRIPQEVQENIIDCFVEDLRRNRRKEVLALRLVSRTWIPRINFHVFRKFQGYLHHCPTLLSRIHSSKFSFGSRIRHLFLDGARSSHNPTLFPYHNDEPALQMYLREFIKYLPYLDSLKLDTFSPVQVAWMPCFSTIKSLHLTNVSIWPSQLFQIISTAALLESLTHDGVCVVYKEGWTERRSSHSPVPSIPSSSVCLKNLKSYDTCLVTEQSAVHLDSHLFPFNLEPKLPSLSRLSLHNIRSDYMPRGIHLLKAAPHSLTSLQLSFATMFDDTDIYSQFFDLSRFEKLEFIRLDNIRPYSTRVTQIDATLAALESLPSNIKGLNVSLSFLDNATEGCNGFQRIDSLLANTAGVSVVEIIPWRYVCQTEMKQRHQKQLRRAFPQLLAKEKLSVMGQRSDISQIFPFSMSHSNAVVS